MQRTFHYAWIIVFVTFLTFLAVQGVRLSFGAFVEPWETDFSMDRGTISLISTLSFVIYGLSQPLIGRLVDKWGARLILSFSTFLVGISIFLTAFVKPIGYNYCGSYIGCSSHTERNHNSIEKE